MWRDIVVKIGSEMTRIDRFRERYFTGLCTVHPIHPYWVKFIYIAELSEAMAKEVPKDMSDIRKRLDVLIGIMLTPKIQNSSNHDKITYLASNGFNNIEIANILNTSTNVVSKEKSIEKKRGNNE